MSNDQEETQQDDQIEIEFSIWDDLMDEINDDMEGLTQQEVVQNMVTAIIHPTAYLMKMGMSEESVVAIYFTCLASLEVYMDQDQADKSGRLH